MNTKIVLNSTHEELAVTMTRKYTMLRTRIMNISMSPDCPAEVSVMLSRALDDAEVLATTETPHYFEFKVTPAKRFNEE